MSRWQAVCIFLDLSDSAEGIILVFDLEEAVMFSELPEEYVDKRTGEIKKRRFTYYPDMYKGRIGKTYSEYVVGEQIDMFENLEDYDKSEGELKTEKDTAPLHESQSETSSSNPGESFDFSIAEAGDAVGL